MFSDINLIYSEITILLHGVLKFYMIFDLAHIDCTKKLNKLIESLVYLVPSGKQTQSKIVVYSMTF